MMHFNVFRTKGTWRWYLVGEDNRIVATSLDGYQSKAECDEAIELVMSSRRASVVQSVYKDRDPDTSLSKPEVEQLTEVVRLALGVS